MITVLYVDDETLLLDLCREILERKGSFKVDTALSTREALDRIHTGAYDVIVSDYLMEEMNGLELLKIVRNEYPAMPFIIFTGKGREEVVIDAYESGVDFYVQKGGDITVQFADLAHKIERAVESRRMRKQLARSEERFHSFVRNFEGIAFQMNPGGHFYLLEGNVEEITGYPRAEFLSGYVTLDAIVHPDDRGQFSESLHHLSSVPGARADPVFRITRKDGHQRWLHGLLNTICNKKNEIVYLQGALQDITYLKSAQDELAKTEEKWRSIITRAPVIISVIDRKGKFLFINKSRPPKNPRDLIGTSASSYLAPDQKRAFSDAAHRVFGTGETVRIESSVHHGREVTEWFTHQIGPVTWDESHPAALVVSTGITERKWLEQNLRDSEEQYRAIVTALGDGVAIIDPHGIITFASPRVYDIFSITGDQTLVGTSALDLIAPSERNDAMDRLSKILSGDLDADPATHTLIRQDGRRIPGTLVTTPLRNSQGEISSLLILIRESRRAQDNAAE